MDMYTRTHTDRHTFKQTHASMYVCIIDYVCTEVQCCSLKKMSDPRIKGSFNKIWPCFSVLGKNSYFFKVHLITAIKDRLFLCAMNVWQRSLFSSIRRIWPAKRNLRLTTAATRSKFWVCWFLFALPFFYEWRTATFETIQHLFHWWWICTSLTTMAERWADGRCV